MASGYPDSLRYLRNRQAKLKFRADGTFRILHLTDIHEVNPLMDDDENPEIPKNKSLETLNVIEKCIEKAEPDLVVFGGDNLSGYWEEFTYEFMADTIRKIVSPIAKRNIPLAVVFGNHDAERMDVLPFLRKENHINIYAEYPEFRSSYNDEDISGCANCSLPVYSSDGESISWNIWLIDSGDYQRDENFRQLEGYADVEQDRIDWYEKRAGELRALNGGEPVPSILFQHICVREMLDIVEETESDSPGAFRSGGKYYRAKAGTITDGLIREMPCPGLAKGQFESWVKTGDIVAAFFGHDHVNTFTTEMKGIKLIQTAGAGYHSYGRERGGRLIVLKEGSREFLTETITVDRITD